MPKLPWGSHIKMLKFSTEVNMFCSYWLIETEILICLKSPPLMKIMLFVLFTHSYIHIYRGIFLVSAEQASAKLTSHRTRPSLFTAYGEAVILSVLCHQPCWRIIWRMFLNTGVHRSGLSPRSEELQLGISFLLFSFARILQDICCVTCEWVWFPRTDRRTNISISSNKKNRSNKTEQKNNNPLLTEGGK